MKAGKSQKVVNSFHLKAPLFFPAKRGVGVGASLASALRPPPDGEKP